MPGQLVELLHPVGVLGVNAQGAFGRKIVLQTAESDERPDVLLQGIGKVLFEGDPNLLVIPRQPRVEALRVSPVLRLEADNEEVSFMWNALR